MRLVRRPKKDRSDFEVVVTSMLDINFLLSMFFMVTAQFQRETHAPIDLPQEAGEKQPEIDEAGLVINLRKDGEIVVSGNTVDFVALQGLVQREVDRHGAGDAKTIKLMVRADREASAADLNRVVALLREAGIGAVRIATETPL